jgi:hypothetical protein
MDEVMTMMCDKTVTIFILNMFLYKQVFRKSTGNCISIAKKVAKYQELKVMNMSILQNIKLEIFLDRHLK